MRSLTQLAAPARLALSSRQRHRNTPGTVLTSPTTAGAVPLYTDSAHVPPELNAAAEVQQERPHYREQTAGMATFASGRQRWVDLVARLLPGSTPDQQRIRNAMFAVDRACFVEPHTPEALVYEDCPVPIGYAQTISAPHMHATCLELLEPKLRPGARVLDVGSGSGYLTAVFGQLVGPSGFVLGVEKMEPLAKRSIGSIESCQPQLLKDGTVRIVSGNALGDVLQDEQEPFDAIHVGAAAATMPETLLMKLAPGGRMVIPVGGQDEFQTLQVLDKDKSGHVTATPLMAVRYVPLTAPEQ